MKYFSLMFAPALLAAVISLGVVRPPMAVATYNNTVSGSQTAAPEAEGIALNLTAAGDLPGMSRLTLVRTNSDVTAGSWTMTVLPQNADAKSSDRGTLTGTVSGGTVTLNTDGTLASASSVQVTIQSGTGEYAGVSGSATVNVSSNAENPSQLSGTLVLNF